MIGVSVKTLQRWDYDGKLKAYRSPSDRRYYTHKQYADYIGYSNSKHGKTIIYARFSIIHVFSCRIYGLRKYKQKIEEDEDIVKEL